MLRSQSKSRPQSWKKIIKSKIIIWAGLILILVSFVYFDQQFEPEDVDELVEIANSKTEAVPTEEFHTDGCSLWINGFFNKDFTDICIEHDIKYWRGGSLEERKQADDELRERVNERVPLMGDIMYIGVRAFGFPNPLVPWGWGYGFDE